jgi:hypothetical protein
MLPQSLSVKKPFALGSLSTLVLGLSLICIPALAQGIFSLFVFAFGKNMDLLFYANAMSNMVWLNAVPPVIGGVLLAFTVSRFIRARYRVDWGRTRKQTLHLSSWVLIAAVAVSCFVIVGLPTSRAMNTATTGYILDTPVSDFDYLIGNYSNGNIYAINGSNWDNLVGGIGSTVWSSYTTNYTKIEELTLQAMSGGGKVLLKNVAFNLALMDSIPVNVTVVCSYGSQEYAYINPSSSVGSPYTVSVGQGLNGGYYTGEDAQGRICFTSTNSTSLIDDVSTVCSNGDIVSVKHGVTYVTFTFDSDALLTVQTAGVIITVGQVVFYDSSTNKMALGKADTSTTMGKGYVYLAMNSNVEDGKVLLLENGVITNSAWTWTAGDTLYVSASTSGLLVADFPSLSGNQVLQVGEALIATSIHFQSSIQLIEIY